jgi:hypothetical protein
MLFPEIATSATTACACTMVAKKFWIFAQCTQTYKHDPHGLVSQYLARTVTQHDDSLEGKMAADPLKNKKMLNRKDVDFFCFVFFLSLNIYSDAPIHLR